MNGPAEPFEHILAEPVPIARRWAAVISPAVTLDAKIEAALILGVHREIDPIASDTDLGLYLMPASEQGSANGLFERRFGFCRRINPLLRLKRAARIADVLDRLEGEQRLVAERTSLDRAKTSFLASASHDLRTPLTSIIGYVELLADDQDGPVPPAQARMLDGIDRNARRLKTSTCR